MEMEFRIHNLRIEMEVGAMFYMIFDLMMAVIMLLFGVWFYKSEGRAAKFLSGYNMKSEEERKNMMKMPCVRRTAKE